MAFSGVKHLIDNLGWPERLFILSVALAVAGGPLGWGAVLVLLVRVLATLLALIVAWRYALRIARRVIWRLRNRLIVAYLFIAVVPILLLVVLGLGSVWMISGQVAAYLLNIEMDRRVGLLHQTATSLAKMTPQMRSEAVRRAGSVFRDRYPGLEILVHGEDGREVRYPEDSSLTVPPVGHAESSGLVIRSKTFHLWSYVGGPQSEVVVLVPVTRTFLQNLVPQLGFIQLQPLGVRPGEVRELDVRLHANVVGESLNVGAAAAPKALSFFDFPLKWGVALSVPQWERPETPRTIFLGAVTRISGPLRIVFSVDTSNDAPTLLVGFAFLAILFLIVELIAAWVGISLSRTITSAVNELYEATVRIRDGDLGHRIEVMGNDQLAELGTSFNIMAGNLERLLRSEKERQRLQAELEIAREVQAQLHPKPMPGLGALRISSICNAARMVSGDYFDYQALGDTRLALAIGDVAGKGISAALLMATLQSAMRSQLRHCVELAEAAGSGDGAGERARVNTAKLVSNLNQQLFASTAPEKYATFFFSVYDDRNGTLTYTNAGHLSPILIRDGKASALDSNGMVVGAFPFARYGESTLEMQPGDLLAFYTDGITEPGKRLRRAVRRRPPD